ncbi:CLUMA_CG020635, isoform A [Clunio marinus]|uniref:CLUMA_CG020635, isoform A n=1 Tax=Clunio marinus TaxID=568069 RepID=A0A1J1J873_9DIPT|nr:CLUMA_CG020635, isoform A [Clunio marinus]
MTNDSDKWRKLLLKLSKVITFRNALVKPKPQTQVLLFSSNVCNRLEKIETRMEIFLCLRMLNCQETKIGNGRMRQMA